MKSPLKVKQSKGFFYFFLLFLLIHVYVELKKNFYPLLTYLYESLEAVYLQSFKRKYEFISYLLTKTERKKQLIIKEGQF